MRMTDHASAFKRDYTRDAKGCAVPRWIDTLKLTGRAGERQVLDARFLRDHDLSGDWVGYPLSATLNPTCF